MCPPLISEDVAWALYRQQAHSEAHSCRSFSFGCSQAVAAKTVTEWESACLQDAFSNILPAGQGVSGASPSAA
eukprot:6208974-Pleurochrysis_carterae.AAC.1